MLHSEPHALSGKSVKLIDSATHPQFESFGGETFVVEDWWDRVAGGPWTGANGNLAAMIYGVRSAQNGLPVDDEVVYGKLDWAGCIVHVSELGEVVEEEERD